MSVLAKVNGWMIAGKVIGEIDNTIFFQPIDSKFSEMIDKTSTTEKIFESGFAACNWIDKQKGKPPTFPEYENQEVNK